MRISVFGVGYVGAVSVACLARDGHDVIGVDTDDAKLARIAQGRSPVAEEGLDALMREAVAAGRVRVTSDCDEAVAGSEVSLVCVGTPSAADGSQDRSALVRVSEEIGAALARKAEPHVVAFRSTLLPGTLEDVLRPVLENASGKRDGEGFFLCVVPEFLREGSSIRDYDGPPFTVVGAQHEAAFAAMTALFGHLPCRLIRTSVRTAETLKLCCNNFHALKITFANETARLCEALGVDGAEVMALLCQDTRLNISEVYLQPGFAFGGSCLPKDLRATAHLARERDVSIPMLEAILPSNDAHLRATFDAIVASGARRIGMVGLTFKAGTDDLRESPLVALAAMLLASGRQVAIYDADLDVSRLLGANCRYAEQHLPQLERLMRGSVADVIADSDLLVVARNDRAVADALNVALPSGMPVVELAPLPRPRS